MTFKSKFCIRDRSALSEATASPIFLFQRKVWQLIQIPYGYETEDGVVFETLSQHVGSLIEDWQVGKGEPNQSLYDFLGWRKDEYDLYIAEGKDAIPYEYYEEREPKTLSWEQLAEISAGAYDVPCAISHWETDRVFLTREEATKYGENRHYNYVDGWRVYSVCAQGELIEVLKDGTEMTLKLGD